MSYDARELGGGADPVWLYRWKGLCAWVSWRKFLGELGGKGNHLMGACLRAFEMAECSRRADAHD